ncbi:hypothetical protein QAD02_008554 [Eretmocerus hayati]|uniref:Uncharacterized protein n=1 Tax=Eretmocerus hayati TaxID=131215 RepID=A0ACC2N765_9HYME|nr:hypothetical protein QAD02_008554 [Eretmocerus hayati]
MAVLCRFRGFVKKSKYLGDSMCLSDVISTISKSRSLSTVVEQPRPKSILKISLIGVGVGALLGTGYAFRKINRDRQNIALEGTEIEVKLLKYKPDVKPSRKVISPVDATGLKLTLFQYQTCPFCCKVRVLLDYYGLSYDVVEVDPVLRQEISWSEYRKVPILLVKVDKGYQPLNDSSMIVSVLASYLNDRTNKIEELSKYYPAIGTHDEKGSFKHEILNKYYLMYQNVTPQSKDMNSIVEERKWRQWADEVFVHTLSPNVYRTLSEAFQTFNWFSKVGHWEEYFPLWERAIMINVGALAMWLISKRLKKRHNLKDDVRESFYDEINVWLNEIKVRGGTFMGGSNPDLSDLAVYGVLKSIEGCEAFQDALKHTKLGLWYNAMREKVESHAGSVYPNN